MGLTTLHVHTVRIAVLDSQVRSKSIAGDCLAWANSAWSITHPTLVFLSEIGIIQNHMFFQADDDCITCSLTLVQSNVPKWPKTANFFQLRVNDANTFLIPVKFPRPLASTKNEPLKISVDHSSLA